MAFIPSVTFTYSRSLSISGMPAYIITLWHVCILTAFLLEENNEKRYTYEQKQKIMGKVRRRKSRSWILKFFGPLFILFSSSNVIIKSQFFCAIRKNWVRDKWKWNVYIHEINHHIHIDMTRWDDDVNQCDRDANETVWNLSSIPDWTQ
jgi:hypothetical protein